jgi:RNA polymerase sigma-70 factor (ECF subfamily)
VNKVDYHDTSIPVPLVEECRKGSSKAQFMVYKLYSRAMFSLAFRMMNNREDAEDVMQEVFLECFRNIGSFRFESTFGAWLKSILINRCINHLRKKKADLILCENIPIDVYEEDTEIQYDTTKIFNAIEHLPDGYRIVLTLYLLEGYDHTEIAQILGVSESTSKSQYSRAKEKLRSMLKKN